MRWLIAALGVVGLAGALYLGLEPRLNRPVLRIALNLRPADPDDAALAEGVALALDDRDERAGRFRVRTAHQTVRANGRVDKPHPCAHTMLHGLEQPPSLMHVGNTLFIAHTDQQANTLLAWMRSRNLKRLSLPLHPPYRNPVLKKGRPQERPLSEVERAAPAAGVETSAFVPGRHDEAGLAAEILATRPDAVFLSYPYGFPFKALIDQLRNEGFGGPVFLEGWRVENNPLAEAEGGLVVLCPLKPAPPEFLRRHAHPFAYAGYLATLAYLDALDATPTGDPLAQAQQMGYASAFEALRDEPRVYRIQGGRFHPVPPK